MTGAVFNAEATDRPETACLAIEVAAIGTSFGDTVALEEVSLIVQRGSVFALLGPNGSGKTTLVHLLSTLRLPDVGSASVLGHDLRTAPGKTRERIGVTGQFSAVDAATNTLQQHL